MQHPGNVWMPKTGCRPRLAQKAKPRRFITKVSLANDFQCHGTTQIDIERLVSDAHRTATQLDWFPVVARHQFIMLKALQRLYWCRLGRFLKRRLAGRNHVSETLAKHADRTEFHCSRKLVTAAWADASGLRAHGPNRAPVAFRASQSAWISSPISAGSETASPRSTKISV